MMVIKTIDPMAVGGDADHTPVPEKAAPGTKETITVKVDKATKFGLAYGGKPTKIANKVPLKTFSYDGKKGVHNVKSLTAADFGALEKKIAGGGLHPTFEMEKDLAKQTCMLYMQVPHHVMTSEIPKHELEVAKAHHTLEHLAAQIAHDMTAELNDKIMGYIMATFT